MLSFVAVLGCYQVLEGGKHPGSLKDAVASPGGTTIAGIHEVHRRCAAELAMAAQHEPRMWICIVTA